MESSSQGVVWKTAGFLVTLLSRQPGRNQLPSAFRRTLPRENIDLAIIRTDFEEQVIRAVPLVENFLDNVIMPIDSKAHGPLIGLSARVALDLNLHTYPAVWTFALLSVA